MNYLFTNVAAYRIFYFVIAWLCPPTGQPQQRVRRLTKGFEDAVMHVFNLRK